MKQCVKCKKIKPITEFVKSKNKKDGLQDECKACTKLWRSSISGKSSRLLSGCKSRVKRSGGVLSINREWIEKKLKIGICEVTGLTFNYEGKAKHTRQAYAPSIDRKNPQNPDYTPENSQVVLWAVNSAMSEYGVEIMMPIFKKIVENAQQKSAAPVSEGSYIQGAVGAELGSISTPWTWEDSNNPNNHRRTISRENLDHRTQTSSGDSVVSGSTEVVASEPFTRIEDHGQPDAEIIRLDFGRRHLSD